jgi:CHAD domain-containing protein
MSLDKAQPRNLIRKLRRFLKKATPRPSPKEVHSFRTNLRRLEATLEAFAMNRRHTEQRLLRDLSRLGKRAGKIRDMDVLTACASTVQADGEEDCRLQLLEYLGARRYKYASRMRDLVRKHGSVLRKRLKRSLRHLQSLLQKPDPIQSDHRPSAPLTAMATALELSSELYAPARLTKRNLHSYRLKVKELRSVLQMSDSTDSQPFVDTLGEVKDAIGDWHDCEELVAIATEVLEHGKRCKLLRELNRISVERFQRARSMAYGLRKTYLSSERELPADAKNKHRRQLKLTRPVLVATSAIAEKA